MDFGYSLSTLPQPLLGLVLHIRPAELLRANGRAPSLEAAPGEGLLLRLLDPPTCRCVLSPDRKSRGLCELAHSFPGLLTDSMQHFHVPSEVADDLQTG